MPVPKPAPRWQVAIIGAGPAGLMAAEALARGGAAVTVYDRMPSAGRKLLMAGRGGLNLTHSEASEPFLARYGDAAPAPRPRCAPPSRHFRRRLCAPGPRSWASRHSSAPADGCFRAR